MELSSDVPAGRHHPGPPGFFGLVHGGVRGTKDLIRIGPVFRESRHPER